MKQPDAPSAQSSPDAGDEALLCLFFDRNEQALCETERRWGRLLFGVAYRILGNAEDSRECVNDALLRLWNAIPPARPAALRAYAVQTLRRVAIDRYRERTRTDRVPSELTVSMDECAELLSGEDAPDEFLHAEAVGSLIGDYLRTLPTRRRYVFLERFYFVTPVAVIARELKITESAVYKELARLRRELRDYLAAHGVYV